MWKQAKNIYTVHAYGLSLCYEAGTENAKNQDRVQHLRLRGFTLVLSFYSLPHALENDFFYNLKENANALDGQW